MDAVLGVAGALEDGHGVSVVVEQVQPEGDGGAYVVGAHRHVQPVDLTLLEVAPPGPVQQVAEALVVPPVAAAHAEQPRVRVTGGNGGEGEVGVGPAQHADAVGDHGQRVTGRAEVFVEDGSSGVSATGRLLARELLHQARKSSARVVVGDVPVMGTG